MSKRFQIDTWITEINLFVIEKAGFEYGDCSRLDDFIGNFGLTEFGHQEQWRYCVNCSGFQVLKSVD